MADAAVRGSRLRRPLARVVLLLPQPVSPTRHIASRPNAVESDIVRMANLLKKV